MKSHVHPTKFDVGFPIEIHSHMFVYIHTSFLEDCIAFGGRTGSPTLESERGSVLEFHMPFSPGQKGYVNEKDWVPTPLKVGFACDPQN